MVLGPKDKLFLAAWAVLFLTFSFESAALAWGPISHMAINSQASKSSGNSESVPEFVMGAHSPDMISLWHVMVDKIPIISQGSGRYDYGHNLINSADNYSLLDVDKANNALGIPLFGKKLLKAYARTGHPKRFTVNGKHFAFGWTGHQLADRYAHGTTGYASTKETFSQLPYVVKFLTNHGAAEFVVDAIVFEKLSDGLPQIYIPSHPALVHEGAIRYYNDVKNTLNEHTITRKNLITCSVANSLARNWSIYLGAYQKLIKKSLSRPWFPEAKEYYSDYVSKYNQSVEAVASFLNNPTYEIAAAQQPFSQRFAFLFNLFKRLKSFFRSEKVKAEEVRVNEQLPETLYYTFVNDVAQEAETLGALQTTEQTIVADPNVTGAKSYEFATEVVNEDAFQKALTTVINRDLAETNSLETRLWAKFMEGLYLRDDLSFREITKRAQDFTPPTIANLTPNDGSFINTSNSAIHASVVDDLSGIGLDLASVGVRVDGMSVDHSYVEGTNLVLYTPSSTLAEGEHTVTLEAADKAGNKAISSWAFTIDTIPPEITHEVQNKIINIKKKSKAVIQVSANEKHVSYLMEVFRVKDGAAEGACDKEGKIDKGEKVYSCAKGVDLSVVDWDGTDDNGQPVANGVYVLRITATDRAGNETSFEEQANVNNKAGGA